MAIVNNMYSEKESLTTTIEWNIKEIIHQRGEDWCPVEDWNTLLPDLDDVAGGGLPAIARDSGLDVDAFVFLTGSMAKGKDSYGQELLGYAYIGTTCENDTGARVSLTKVVEGEWKGNDTFTAEVRLKCDPGHGY